MNKLEKIEREKMIFAHIDNDWNISEHILHKAVLINIKKLEDKQNEIIDFINNNNNNE